ncbi:DUF4952 domain-containing protein [Leptospira santarosai]|uniref:DUF4952 domain-containing protein n=1 Tax=Leptospira santarosai TaxID=28183 RepID=UPI000BB9E531|nr:DUF4952 domain-containing protein [Leptospira santarosai]ASV11196.1 DUF4952 domain-containing protein [Leptospira santarosai]MDI7163631.1 DUF4952 domain-containing protein [Leptospira santarosai]
MKQFAFFLLFFTSAVFAHPPCGDFLKQHGKKPKHLEFVKCIKEQDRQIPTLVAIYRVKGKYASEVEKYCIDNFEMPPLQKICCYWGPMIDSKGRHEGFLKSGWNGFYYTIDMGADSSGSDKREDWSEIDWFTVTVELSLRDP